jgi:RNA polymerase sigma-70 factor (ECF subfamily)
MNFDSEGFISSLKRREHKSVSELISEYQSFLIKGALSHKLSMEQAEDVVAETWGTFFEKVENFEGRSKIKTYLFGIMYNKVRETKRQQNRFVDIEDPQDLLGANFDEKGFWAYTPAEPDAFIQATELKSNLDICLEALNDNQKRAFYMKEIQGESTSEICESIGITLSNFKVTLHRARNQIRRCIEGKHA